MSIFNCQEIISDADRNSAIEWCKQHIVGFQAPNDQPIRRINYFTTERNGDGKVVFSTSQVASVFFMGDDNFIHCKDCLLTIILKNIDSEIPEYVKFSEPILITVLYNSPCGKQFLTKQFWIKESIYDSKHSVRFAVING